MRRAKRESDGRAQDSAAFRGVTVAEQHGPPSLGLGALRSDPGAPLGSLARLRRLAALEREDLWVVVIYAAAAGLVSLAVPIAAQSLVNTDRKSVV